MYRLAARRPLVRALGRSASAFPKAAGFATSKDNDASENKGPAREAVDRSGSVYVHPLSHLILEYLQNEHHHWVVAHGLDRSLTIHRDGTFEIKFMDEYFNDSTAHSAVLDGTTTQTEEETEGASAASEESPDELMPKHRIWTCFDDVEKKHWLTVHRGDGLHERFLLQDNLVPSWHGNRTSLPERIHASVNDLIRAVHNHSMANRSLLNLNNIVRTKGSGKGIEDSSNSNSNSNSNNGSKGGS